LNSTIHPSPQILFPLKHIDRKLDLQCALHYFSVQGFHWKKLNQKNIKLQNLLSEKNKKSFRLEEIVV